MTSGVLVSAVLLGGCGAGGSPVSFRQTDTYEGGMGSTGSRGRTGKGDAVQPMPVLVARAVTTEAAAAEYALKGAQQEGSGPDDCVTMLTAAEGSTGQHDDLALNASAMVKGPPDVKVRMRAAYTEASFYLALSWKDPTSGAAPQFELDRYRWFWDLESAFPPKGWVKGFNESKETWLKNRWAQSFNDDKVALMIDSADSTTAGPSPLGEQGCAATCHGGGHTASVAHGVDLWVWSSGVSNPMGCAEDRWLPPGGRPENDEGTPAAIPNATKGKEGDSVPQFVWSGKQQKVTTLNGKPGVLNPVHFLLKGCEEKLAGDPQAGGKLYATSCLRCHGSDGRGTKGTKAPDLTDAASFGALSQKDLRSRITAMEHADRASIELTEEQLDDMAAYVRGFSGVPGLVLSLPSGSQSDVLVTNADLSAPGLGVLHNGTYTVVLKRALDTQNRDDVKLAAGVERVVSLALMDRDSKNHVGKAVIKLRLETDRTEAR